MMENHEKWLNIAIEMAIESVRQGGGPYASIVVKDGTVIGTGTNRVHLDKDPSAHAELLAIREACSKLGTVDLSDCILYASGEPCPMCLGAAYWSTIGHIYYACGKSEAKEIVGSVSPVESFFTDQEKAPEDRLIPFTHLKTGKEQEPFKAFISRD